MRWIFVIVTVVLFELLSYGAARSLIWALNAWIGTHHIRWIWWGGMGISHLLLFVAILRVFPNALKLAMTWLALLWFIILTTAIAYTIDLILRRMSEWNHNIQYSSDEWLGLMFITILMALTARALFNAYAPVVRHITIQTDKTLTTPLRIAMVSDIHLGRLVGNREINLLRDLVTRQHVQLLLMPGDILDDEPSEFYKRNMGVALQQLVDAVPLGVYATLGNHDLYGHREENTQALTKHGVKVLDDSHYLVNDQVWIVGRLDDHVRNRKPTHALLPADNQRPIILMDHEPTQVVENAQLPIDLQVSGHTHNGQIFPANLIVQRLYKVAYGHAKIQNTDVIVSSGYGFWGVPFRLGSRAEVWIIDLVGTPVTDLTAQ